MKISDTEKSQLEGISVILNAFADNEQVVPESLIAFSSVLKSIADRHKYVEPPGILYFCNVNERI